VRAAARGTVDAVYDHHAAHAAGIVGREPPAEFARGVRWCGCGFARVDTGLAGSHISKSAKSMQAKCKEITRPCKATLAYKVSTFRGLFQLNRVQVGKAIPSTTRTIL
jgi:hypothetical protein